MALYFIIFALLCLCSLIEYYYGIKHKKKIIILFFIFFWCLSTFRWETGLDWETYYEFFINCRPTSFWLFDAGFEIGYAALNIVIRQVTDSYNVLLGICGFIVLFCIYKVIMFFEDLNKASINPSAKDYKGSTFLILVFFWAISFMNIFTTRRLIAFSICFFALTFVHKRKLFAFFLTIAIATLFHTAALIFLIAYPLYHLKNKSNIVFLSTIFILLVMPVLAKPIIEFTIYILRGTAAGGRIEHYFNIGLSEQFGSQYSTFFSIFKGMLNTIFVLCMLGLLYRKNKNDRTFVGINNTFCIASILYTLGSFTSFVFVTISSPFLYAQIFVAPYFLRSIKDKPTQICVLFGFFIYFGLRMHLALNNFDEGVLFPFKTIFGGVL